MGYMSELDIIVQNIVAAAKEMIADEPTWAKQIVLKEVARRLQTHAKHGVATRAVEKQ